MQLFEETSKRQQGNEQKGMDMLSNNKKLIAVIGATGQQGGGVALASKIPGLRPTKFSTWARANFHVQVP